MPGGWMCWHAGRDSRYAKYFDIDWEPADPHLRGKVLLPVLGRPYGEALAAGEITLRDDERRQRLASATSTTYFRSRPAISHRCEQRFV